MTAMTEWAVWEKSWRAARTSDAELEAMIARTNGARRAALSMRLLSTALTVGSLALVGAALRHAGNPFEAALGLVVGVGIGTVWFVDSRNQRAASEQLEAPLNEYLAARRRLCVRQIAFVRLAWIVVAMDLAFLIPWWIGGTRVHGGGFHALQLVTTWAPLTTMAAFVAWTLAVRTRARTELEQLATSSPDEYV